MKIRAANILSTVVTFVGVVATCVGLTFLSISLIATGCDGRQQEQSPQGGSVRTADARYVCIGMETSKRFGKCSGCSLDAYRMNELLGKKLGYSGVMLQSERATRSAVVSAIRNAIDSVSSNGLFILYYSGHGGSERLSGKDTVEPDGADENDEYLCLYDTYLLDDEVWSLVSRCRARAFLIFDCCHSQTMFRSVVYDIAAERGLAVPLEEKLVKSSGFNLPQVATPLGADEFRMLCWSGCLEAEYSYGGKNGGVMTNAMLSRWKNGMSYKELWGYVLKDVTKLQPTQHPKATQYGGGFVEAFK